MAKLILSKNEYTVVGLLDQIREEHGVKSNGSPFNVADIHDWANKGRIPVIYGGQFMYTSKLGPLKIMLLSDVELVNHNGEVPIEKE